jgi:hypothetical protein
MAKKPLITHKELLKALDYDPTTGEFRWKYCANRTKQRNSQWAGKAAGHIGIDGYARILINGKQYLSHRLAWLYVIGRWPYIEIDHINGNRLDNRFSNLREATRSNNSSNTKKLSANLSGVKGVHWNSDVKKWAAQITKSGRRYHLGYFDNIEEATLSRQKAADRLHGKFANHG